MQIGVYKCLLNHKPIYPPGTPDPYNDHDKNINPKGFDFFITGHIHQKRLWTGRSLNVGVDMHDFYPISEERVIELLRARAEELGDRKKYGELFTQLPSLDDDDFIHDDL